MQGMKEIVEGVKLVKSEITNKFHTMIKETLYEYDEANYHEEDSYGKFKLRINHETVEFIRNQLDVVYSKMINEQKKTLDVFIANIFKDIKPGWWNEFSKSFDQRRELMCNEIDNLASDSEELKSIFNEELNTEKKREFFLVTRDSFMRKFRMFNTMLLDKFKRSFEKTKNGLRLKEFKLFKDEVIQDDFDKSREYILKIFDEGAKAEFPGFLDEDPRKLMKIEEEENMKYDLEEKLQDRLTRAINAKYSYGTLNKIPKWVWLIIAILARHDIINVITTPTIMFPLC